MPCVSVIIPVYNQAHFIRDAVESVVTQTFTDWEIIVVDDGSTDDTPLILADLARQIPLLQVICQPNRGRSAARNAGIRAAMAPFLVFLDGDDWLCPGKLERQVAYLEKHPEIGVVYSDAMLCDEDGKELVPYSAANLPWHPSGNIVESLFLRDSVPIHSAMVRRACIERAGLFDERLPQTEDWDFWIRVACHCRFHYQGEVLARYRVHDAMTTRNAEQMWQSYVALQEKIVNMPEFTHASRQVRSHFYRICGIAYGMRGEMLAARERLRRSIELLPWGLGAYVLLGTSYLGQRTFRALVFGKRQVERVIAGRPVSPLQPPW